MTRFEPCFEYTQQEIDEYSQRCLSDFMEGGGNIPFPKFNEEYEMEFAAHRVSINERYYLALQPYAICKDPIIAGRHYSFPQIPQPEKKIDLIKGLNLVSLSTRDTIQFDIRQLLQSGTDSDGNNHVPNGEINLYLSQMICNAVPYITLKEVLQGVVEYIGTRHIYFTEDRFITPPHPFLNGPLNVAILNCHFAENVCHSNR